MVEKSSIITKKRENFNIMAKLPSFLKKNIFLNNIVVCVDDGGDSRFCKKLK